MTAGRALRALGERWWLVLVCLLLGLGGAAATSSVLPREYVSEVTFYASLQGVANDPDAALEAGQLAEDRVDSYAPLLEDERITRRVIDRLGVALTPDQLSQRMTVSVEAGTSVLSVAVRDASPDGAAALANGVAAEFVTLVQEIEEPIGSAPPPAAPGVPAPEPSRIGVEIISPGVPRAEPVAPDVPLNLAVGAAVGLAVGAAAVLLRAARDTSVRSAARLQELTSAPVLAEVAHDRQVATRPLVVDERFGSPRAEAFRRLRTTLQFLDGGRTPRVLVVTSARMGEGTSTTACNLAITLAEAGNRVLLLDANLRDPRVHDYLGLDPHPGLVEVLVGKMAWPYAGRRWHRGALDVLPAGPVSHNPSQLLASAGMGDLLRELREHYEFVVVDTPAVLPVSDAAAVSARADGVVLVVEHGGTSEAQVAAAQEALTLVSAPLVGTVLTRTPPRRRARLRSYREGAPDAAAPASTQPSPATADGAEGQVPAQRSPSDGEAAPASPDAAGRRPSPTPRR